MICKYRCFINVAVSETWGESFPPTWFKWINLYLQFSRFSILSNKTSFHVFWFSSLSRRSPWGSFVFSLFYILFVRFSYQRGERETKIYKRYHSDVTGNDYHVKIFHKENPFFIFIPFEFFFSRDDECYKIKKFIWRKNDNNNKKKTNRPTSFVTIILTVNNR